jgi:hypothetical protein
MADSVAFLFVSEELGERTALEPIEARGTVRIALKKAGLSAQSVTNDQMAVVLERVLPGELEKRGIQDASVLCRELRTRVVRLAPEASPEESPETIFERLGKSH